MQPDWPARLADYPILARLGGGAQGAVYLARDPASALPVALKTAHGDGSGRPAARLRREAALAGALRHPHIVAIHGCREAGPEGAFIVMEYVEGETLQALLARGRPPLARALDWMGQLLGALDYLRAAGVAHGDVKPANLLIGRDGRLKLGDFGLARALPGARGAAVGTPAYMAPEQLRGAPLDGRADLFAAAALCYQMLTGARPFEGTPFQIVQQILGPGAAPPSRRLPALGRAFDAVLARAMARDPDARHRSGRDFQAALTAAAGAPGV